MTRPRPTDSPRRPLAAIAAGLLLLAGIAIPALADDGPGSLHVRLTPDDFDAAWSRLADSTFDIAGRNAEAGTIDLVVSEDLVTYLWELGSVTILDRSRPFREIQRDRIEEGLAVPDPSYKTYAEVLAVMDQIEANNPGIAQKVNLTQLLGTPQTWEGRDIYAMKISDNVSQDEDELAVLFDALHHARELNTIEVALDIMRTLTELYGNNPKVTGVVDSHEVWVVPVVNPDGLEYVWNVNSNWRKNRRDNGNGTFGVDLNRNYPFLWGVCGNNSGNPASDVYRGPAPLSEPEVQTIYQLGLMIRPTIYNSYHSFGREVLPPYVCATLAEPISNIVRDLYRERMSYAWRLASSSGESFEWFYNQASSVGYLTEIGTGFQPPFSQTIQEVKRVRPGWAFLLQAPGLGPLVQGVVTDSISSDPIEAEITSNRVNFSEGERRACEADFGRYGWFLTTSAPHTLTFSADGYQSKQVQVQPMLEGVTLDVELDPQP